jgi:hypothetical protein
MPILSVTVGNFFNNPPGLIAEMWIRAGDFQASGGVLAATANNLGGMTRLDAMNISNAIQDMRTNVGAHRNMLIANETWRGLYQVENRQIIYHNGPRQVETVPCEACGLCLPLTHIEVDHQRPQVGGEVLAVAKVLRTLGLTMRPPRGRKGRQLYARFAHAPHHFSVNTVLALPLVKRPKNVAIQANWVPTPIQLNTRKGQRYSTNAIGSAFLSLVYHMGAIQELENGCLNSFANLKPLCGPCNGRKSNITADNDDAVDRMDED